MSIQELAQEIPTEIRRAINGLDNDTRAAIFVLLLKNKELSFSDVQKETNLPKARLNYHLRKLTESALVQHYYKHALGNPEYSFYSISPFGNNFVEALNQSLQPEPPSSIKQLAERLDAKSTFEPDIMISWHDLTHIAVECKALIEPDIAPWINSLIETRGEDTSNVTYRRGIVFRDKAPRLDKAIVRA